MLASRLPEPQPLPARVPGLMVGPWTTSPIVAAPLPGWHRTEVLRQFSGASGRVMAGQAVCTTCHWEGPRRSGGTTGMLDADAAGHAGTTSGRRSGNFTGR
jgi:hypothetical protein